MNIFTPYVVYYGKFVFPHKIQSCDNAVCTVTIAKLNPRINKIVPKYSICSLFQLQKSRTGGNILWKCYRRSGYISQLRKNHFSLMTSASVNICIIFNFCSTLCCVMHVLLTIIMIISDKDDLQQSNNKMQYNNVTILTISLHKIARILEVRKFTEH